MGKAVTINPGKTNAPRKALIVYLYYGSGKVLQGIPKYTVYLFENFLSYDVV